ncbi:MAG: DUF418 domain-containing protein [Pseudomonadota bacterium]
MSDRALMPDYLRLLALFSIVVVNVQFMAFPLEFGFAGAAHQEQVDEITSWLVNGLALLKTYGLFSFMVGVWLAFQIRSAAWKALPFGRLYRNRMIGQSVLLSTVFAANGLGLWDSVGPAAAVLIALAATMLLIGFLMIWRLRFALGPFEWALRRFTRLGVTNKTDPPDPARMR